MIKQEAEIYLKASKDFHIQAIIQVIHQMQVFSDY